MSGNRAGYLVFGKITQIRDGFYKISMASKVFTKIFNPLQLSSHFLHYSFYIKLKLSQRVDMIFQKVAEFMSPHVPVYNYRFSFKGKYIYFYLKLYLEGIDGL